MSKLDDIIKIELNLNEDLEIFGFVAEPQPKSGYWLCHPATLSNGVVLCHDLSGFLGSWRARGGYFFPNRHNATLCNLTMKECESYCRLMNGGNIE